MIWMLLFVLNQCPARADSPHIPAEMTQKYEDISAALRESYREAQAKVRKADHENDVVHAVLGELGKLVRGVKAKGRGAILYLDRQLHEKVIGTDAEGAAKAPAR